MESGDRDHFTMLTMLHAMCEQALTRFESTGSRIGRELIPDLEKMIERTRSEINAVLEAADPLPP